MKECSKFIPTQVIGLDVGDDRTQVCVLSPEREVLEEFSVPTRHKDLRRAFEGREPCRVVLEVGPHSRWMSQEVQSLGHEVLVVDARRLDLIARSTCKTDRRDALVQAQLGAAVPEMLGQVKHRSDQAQADLAMLHSRDHLVEMRTRTVLRVRGVLKSWGVRVPRMSTKVFHRSVGQFVPEKLRPALIPLLEEILELNIRIHRLTDQIEEVAKRYPMVERLQAVNGVGVVTSLAFVLAIDDPSRFKKSRDVGSWVGLCPRMKSSGRSNPQLSITRAGNPFLRRLLVNAAHCVLARGADCDLRHYGQRIVGRGGKYAKKRAVVAVARKLAVLLHRLWVAGEAYDPWRQLKRNGGSPPTASPVEPSQVAEGLEQGKKPGPRKKKTARAAG